MIAFTICSNNYLPKAMVLAESLNKHGSPIYLFLADCKQRNIHYDNLGFAKVVYLEDLAIHNLQWMKENYSVIEFNTAIKPFAYQYLFDKTEYNAIYYFDPDIKVYKSLEDIDKLWKNYKFILTPHVLTPVPFDGKFPGENLYLNHGMFNLGFLGIRRSSSSSKFINWWIERLTEQCIIDLKEGYFVDQIWCNFLPIYYSEQTLVCKEPGLNMSYWNLHERKIIFTNDKYIVNDDSELYFYHFSSFDITLQILTPTANARYQFCDFPDLKILYEDYKTNLMKYNPFQFKEIPYFNNLYPIERPKEALFKKVIRKIKNNI